MSTSQAVGGGAEAVQAAAAEDRMTCGRLPWPAYIGIANDVIAIYCMFNVILPFFIIGDDPAAPRHDVVWIGIIGSAQSLGMLIGTLAWGCFNDKYGAVIALPLSVLAQCICQFLSLGFVDSEPALLAACRFLSAGPCGWQGGLRADGNAPHAAGSAGCVAEVIE